MSEALGVDKCAEKSRKQPVKTRKTQCIFTKLVTLYLVLHSILPGQVWGQLTIGIPSFPTTNTVQLNLGGTQSTNAHIIFFTPSLTNPLASWNRLTTGGVGQISFTLSKPTNNPGFFAAGVAPIATPTVATPIFIPAGGRYGNPTNVSITSATPGAAIYYTTNGNTPTPSDNFLFSGSSIYVAAVTTLKAKAFASGYQDSAVVTATYTINAAPFVSAGPQQIITGSPATLQGFVSDDGLAGGGTKFTNWSKISGPGAVTFGNSLQTNTTASFSASGVYVLQLSASDGQYTNSSLVTIAQNPSVSVTLDSPVDGSTYTVPTNFTMSATALCGSGSVTQMAFYANNTLITTVTSAPYSFNWKSVPAGNLSLTAVAYTTDTANTAIASAPVNVTVNWPTNVGQVTATTTDLQIPAAGYPLTVNRVYDTRYASTGSFGYNGKLDYEQVSIQKSSSLSSGWFGGRSGLTYYVSDTAQHVVTVSLSPSEQYYFVPQIIFVQSGTNTIRSSSVPTCYNFFKVKFAFTAIGQGSLTVSGPSPSRVGLDDDLSGWKVPLTVTRYDGFGFPTSDYDPAYSDFTFTAPDGTKYNFDENGNLSQKTDRNGNYLQFSYGGILHSSGKQITFTRDQNNRIAEVYDPIAIETGVVPTLTYSYDDAGNLTNVSRLVDRLAPAYFTNSYAFTNLNFPNNLTSVTDPRGVVTARYEYDAIGRVARQYDAFGLYTGYIYDTVNHRQIITDRLNQSTVQSFTPSGLLAATQDGAGGVTTFGYDSQGRKIAETNAVGKVTTYSYDGDDNLISVTNETGNVSGATYDTFGKPLTTVDNLGNGTTNSYDASGNLLFTTNALGVVTAYGYDSQGNVLAETNALGLPEQVAVANAYDQFGNLTNTATLDALGNVLSSTGYTYDSNGNKLTQSTVRTTSGGAQTVLTQYGYDAANRVIQVMDALGGTNLTFYNGLGKQSHTVDALGRMTSYFYDFAGQLTNTTYPDGNFEITRYDPEGRKTSFVDRGGHASTYSYDSVGRLLQTTYADGSYSASSYDLAGRLVKTTQGSVPSGLVPISSSIITARYAYDAEGRRTNSLNALNQGNYFAYDANGNQTNSVDALNLTNAAVFDVLNRQIKAIFPDNTIEGYGYDALGRKIASTNQANIVTRFGFDALSRLVAVTNAFGTSQQLVTRYAYDESGNLTQQMDGLGHSSFFEYDNAGHRTKQILPGNQFATYGYDAVGNLIRETNFNGVVITNQYDVMNRLTNRTSSGGYQVRWGYSATGERTSMVDASGTNSYLRDLRDRLVTNVTPQGTLVYTYEPFGNLSSITSTTTNGVSLKYGYDIMNRLTNVVDRYGNSTTYGFDAVGNLQTVTLPNLVTNTYQFDTLNHLTNLTARTVGGSAVAAFSYTLGAMGNRTKLTESVNGVNRTNGWFYDPLYRLTGETIAANSGPTGLITNKYDSVGNRLTLVSTVAGVTNQSFTFNSNDQLSTDVYDSNGNTRTNLGNVFQYDVLNRLTNALVGGTNIAIMYDGDGNRVRKVIGSTTNTYLVDTKNPTGYAQVLEEKSNGTLIRTYTYGLDLISQKDSATLFYGYDGNGNTRYLTATNAAITDTFAYDVFGIPIARTGTNTVFYQYSGEQYDPNLGLIYLRARYLSASAGRFWTRDSFEGDRNVPASLHKYLYAADNPANGVDPSGNDLEDARIGRLVHQQLGSDFVEAAKPFGISGPSIATILQENVGIRIDTITALFPDLVSWNPANKEVYEIKPISSGAVGYAQLLSYISVFNYFDKDKTWKPGASYVPPKYILVDALTEAIVFPPVYGVIIYEAFSVKKFVRKRTVNVAVSEGADVQDSFGISTTTSILGGG